MKRETGLNVKDLPIPKEFKRVQGLLINKTNDCFRHYYKKK